PCHIQAQIVTFDIDSMVRTARHLGPTNLTARTAGDYRQGIIADVITNGASRLPTSESNFEIAVTFERLADQLVQGRIIELLPPHAFKMAAVVATGSFQRELCRRSIRSLVVRPHSARCQCHEQQTWRKKFKGFH